MSHAGEGGTGARSGVGGVGAGEAGFGGGGGGTLGGIGDRGGAGETRGSTAAQRRGSAGRTDVGRLSSGGGEESALGKLLKRAGANLLGKIEGIPDKLTSPRAIGAGIGLLAGGVPGAQFGSAIGSLFESEEQKAPGTPTTQAQAAPTVAQAAPSVTPQDISAQRQFTNIGQLGGDSGLQQVVAAPPQVSRESGIQQPQLAGLGQQLPQQRFLNQGGVLPTVNLGAFPGALGRV